MSTNTVWKSKGKTWACGTCHAVLFVERFGSVRTLPRHCPLCSGSTIRPVPVLRGLEQAPDLEPPPMRQFRGSLADAVAAELGQAPMRRGRRRGPAFDPFNE